MQELLPDTKVLIVQVLTFALGMAAIWKLYIVALRDHLKARREGIAADLASAEQARREAAELRAQLEAERVRMADELKRARQDAAEQVARLREELMAKAVQQQDDLLRQAAQRIEGEARKAAAEIRGQAADLVVQAAGALLGRRLDSAADRAMAESLVASVRAPGA